MHAGNHKRAAQDIVVLVFQHIFYSSCLINYMLEISDEFDSLKQFFFCLRGFYNCVIACESDLVLDSPLT